MIRILIADDSLTTRLVLKDLVGHDTDIAVIGEASDGREAVEKTLRLRPDLVIMDIMMPGMDGLAATMEIMGRCPTPILILSADADEDSDNAFQAIQFGALDVMAKPVGAVTESFDAIAANLLEKIKFLGRIPVMHHFGRQRRSQPTAPLPAPKSHRHIVAIGASTGGPRAVAHLLSHLSPATNARILVVQHIAKGFADNFAQWLDKESPLTVRLASHGDRMRGGLALVAPNNCHMEVRGERIVLSDAPPVNSCRPSVDALFLSLARHHPTECIAVLLTGMGRDGTAGMLALRKGGGYNIVQDEASSIVFGMPRSAIEARAAHQVLPLAKIPEAVDHLLRTGTGE